MYCFFILIITEPFRTVYTSRTSLATSEFRPAKALHTRCAVLLECRSCPCFFNGIFSLVSIQSLGGVSQSDGYSVVNGFEFQNHTVFMPLRRNSISRTLRSEAFEYFSEKVGILCSLGIEKEPMKCELPHTSSRFTSAFSFPICRS